MSEFTDEILNEIVEIIVKMMAPVKIILFGSRARGNAREDSDLNLLVIVDEPFAKGISRRKQTAKLLEHLSEYHITNEVLVYNFEEVEYWQDSVNHVIARALKEGRVVYARS